MWWEVLQGCSQGGKGLQGAGGSRGRGGGWGKTGVGAGGADALAAMQAPCLRPLACYNGTTHFLVSRQATERVLEVLGPLRVVLCSGGGSGIFKWWHRHRRRGVNTCREVVPCLMLAHGSWTRFDKLPRPAR